MPPRSHGTGQFEPSQFAKLGQNVVFETGVLVFHPENIEIQNDVYIGHYTILKGYFKNKMIIGEGTWVGQQCFFHSAGGIEVGRNVGIGPGVKILTSSHALDNIQSPILHNPVKFAPVNVCDNSDIGVGAIILPGVTIGFGSQVGAGAVVTQSVDDYSIVAGVPAKVLGYRK
jgi:acetyltransferase-like isoleucine patch superfamily enzyme